MDYQLQNKTALVTGSTGGIGLAIAKLLAQEGATVVINGRQEKRVNEAIQTIQKIYPEAKLLPAARDLASESGANQIIQEFPKVDILINNLGIYEAKPFSDITDQDWLHIFNVNVMSGIRLSRHYLPLMLQQNWGRIIFISSESGIQIPAEMIHYGMTKTAQLAISRGLAELTAGTQVTVNSVLPGPTRSEGVEAFIHDIAQQKQITPQAVEKEFFSTMRPSSLIKRFAEVEEVAALVAYLCSPISSATNGAALKVDGGVVRGLI